MLQYITILGAIINLGGSFSYIRNTIRGKTKPNRVTRFFWGLAPLIASGAAFSDGIDRATLPVFMAGFSPLLVFASTFVNKKSYWKLEVNDYGCGLFSLLALLLRRYTKEPTIAIIFAIISDILAAAPTVIKAWKHPETESKIVYITSLCAIATSFFAMKRFDISELAFPLYLIILDIVLIGLISRKDIGKIKNVNH